jgi:hypothetical protein
MSRLHPSPFSSTRSQRQLCVKQTDRSRQAVALASPIIIHHSSSAIIGIACSSKAQKSSSRPANGVVLSRSRNTCASDSTYDQMPPPARRFKLATPCLISQVYQPVSRLHEEEPSRFALLFRRQPGQR